MYHDSSYPTLTLVCCSFQIDVADPRFSDLYKNPLYNIDPSAPEYKKTKATEALIQEKLERRKNKEGTSKTKSVHTFIKETDSSTGKEAKKPRLEVPEESSEKYKTKDLALASLVKSVKAKAQTLQDKKKKKKPKF